MTAIATGQPVPGDEIARAQGTDFFAMDDLLTQEERAIRDRVRAFADDHLIPVANDYGSARCSRPS